jgi:hypothetical protein
MKKLLLVILLFQSLYAKGLPNLYLIQTKTKMGEKKIHRGMYQYIYSHNNEKLKKILEKGSNLNNILPIKLAYTPLYYAVHRGNIDTVKLLLQYGANIDFISPPNDEGKYATTAISAAIANNNISLTKFLLDNNASVNIEQTNFKQLICNKKEVIIPPLFYTYTKEMLELLISKGGNIYQQNTYGETILDWYIGATKIKSWIIDKYKLPTTYYKCSSKFRKIVKVVHTEDGFKEYDINGTVIYEYNMSK